MRIVKLQKKDKDKLFYVFQNFGEVWAPVKKGDSYAYQKIDSCDNMCENPLRTIIPVKKFLMEPEFCMFKFNKQKFEKTDEVPTKKVIMSVHPCDINAVNILDEFYSGEYPDPFYQQRRENLIIIGKSCIPDEHCFCNKSKTDTALKGYDLFLTDLGDYLLIWVGSSKGDDIIRQCGDVISENITDEDTKDYLAFREKRNASFTNDVNLDGIPDLMELRNDAKFWDELGEKCLSCGQCTMVCPTCTCFNTIDELEIGKEEGKRERYWDSCMFREYSLVAGGHNFREARSDRLRLWYTHKLKAFIGKFGSPSCVGCGRCIETCPVDINVPTVVSYIRGKEVNHEV